MPYLAEYLEKEVSTGHLPFKHTQAIHSLAVTRQEQTIGPWHKTMQSLLGNVYNGLEHELACLGIDGAYLAAQGIVKVIQRHY